MRATTLSDPLPVEREPTAPLVELLDRTPEELEVTGALDSGDRRRALQLCSRYYAAPVFRLCLAFLGSAVEAEDVTQETLLAAFSGFEKWQRTGTLKAWLFGIGRRLCAKHSEQRGRQLRRLHLVHEHESVVEPEELMALRARALSAEAALSQLKPTEREALMLRYGGELSFREVAFASGVDEAVARKRVSRGLMHLREVLDKTGELK